MAKQTKVYLRSKGGLSHGWGHVIRSHILANFLNRSYRSIEVLMAVEGDFAIRAFLSKQEVPFILLHENIPINDEELKITRFDPDVIVVDMLEVSDQLLSLYSWHCTRLAVFNDMGRDYTIGNIIIIPQILDNYPEKHEGQKHLLGTDYFIISEDILKARSKVKYDRSDVKIRLLIIMGGCIHQCVFEQIIKVIENLSDLDLRIDFILGYDHEINLEDYRHIESLGVTFITGAIQLGELMSKADLALASSGYVKYELAASGVPSILVSIVDHQEELARAFVKNVEYAQYLGDIREVDVKEVANAIKSLALNHKRREVMAHKSRQLIDGKALERIARELLYDSTS